MNNTNDGNLIVQETSALLKDKKTVDNISGK